MLIFIQVGKLCEVAKSFYEFIALHKLLYTDQIRVETPKGETIHEPITVNDYLLQIPEL